MSDDDTGTYECIADNGRDHQTAEASFGVRDSTTTAAILNNFETSTSQPLAIQYSIGEPTPGLDFQ